MAEDSLCFRRFRIWPPSCIVVCVTPITAPTNTPVAAATITGGPTAGVAAGAAKDASKEVAAGAALPVSTEESGLSWLMAWLGQQGISVDLPEDGAEKTDTPAQVQTKVQWLTLLPTVATFESPDLAVDGNEPTMETEGVAAATGSEDQKQVPVAAKKDSGLVGESEPKTEETSADGNTLTIPTVEAAPVVVVAVPLVTETSVPVAATTDCNPTPSQPTPGPAVQLQTPETSQQPADALARVTAKQADKGEIVWAADFAVQNVTATKPVAVGEATPSRELEQPQVRTESSKVKPETNPKEAVSAVKTASGNQGLVTPVGHRPETNQEEAGANANESETPKQSGESVRERAPGKGLSEGKKEAPQPAEHVESKPVESGVRGMAVAAEFTPRATNSSPVTSAAPVESVAVEPATALKPAQIATLQVDVPAPAGSEDGTPMRLVVSQRGDQVNVRLRSWDAGTAPIEEGRMQPLMNSLAEKGFVSEMKPVGKSEEMLQMTVERIQEKHMTMAESSGSHNDQQSFQNANERQQQNQERQQQQQAFFLRKQMKSVQSEEFTLSPPVEANNGAFQKGATR